MFPESFEEFFFFSKRSFSKNTLQVFPGVREVLREILDDALRDLLPWDIEFVIDGPVDEKEEEPEVSVDCCYSNLLDLLRVKTRVCSYNLYAIPFLSFPSHPT